MYSREKMVSVVCVTSTIHMLAKLEIKRGHAQNIYPAGSVETRQVVTHHVHVYSLLGA